MTRAQFERKVLIDSGKTNIQDGSGNAIQVVSTMADGQVGGILANGGYVFNGSSWDRLKSVAFGADSVGGQGILTNVPRLYNGGGYDRLYNNTQGTLLASGARTASVVGSIQNNFNAKGIALFLNVTVASGTGGLTLKLCAYDNTSGQYNEINLVPTAITATGVYIYMLYPGISGGGVTQATSLALPRQWLVNIAVGDASSYTYSLGYSLIL